MTDHNARQAGLTEHQWHEVFAAKAINGAMLNVRMAVEIVMEALAAHSADARNGEGVALTDDAIKVMAETYANRWQQSGAWNVRRCVENALYDARALLAAPAAQAPTP